MKNLYKNNKNIAKTFLDFKKDQLISSSSIVKIPFAQLIKKVLVFHKERFQRTYCLCIACSSC